MPRLLHQPPKYRLHKGSGQAIVSVAGRKIYLGNYGSPHSHQLYEEAIAQWRKSQPPIPATPAKSRAQAEESESEQLSKLITTATLREKWAGGLQINFNELILVYRRHARKYYRKDGKLTREAGNIDEVLRFLRKHHGGEAVDKFGPVTLDNLRDKMIEDLDWSRKYINKQVSRLLRMFKWAVEQELATPNVHTALAALAGLKKNRTIARESAGVQCVPDTLVDQTIPSLPEIVADMVRLQRLTGARPGEICLVRPGDIDRSGEVWRYCSEGHKTEHHDQNRVVMIGPLAQAVLRPYLLRPAKCYCFSPVQARQCRCIGVVRYNQNDRHLHDTQEPR